LRTSAARARDGPPSSGADAGSDGALLVVDDDEANRTMLARRLMRLATGGAAANGRLCLERSGPGPSTVAARHPDAEMKTATKCSRVEGRPVLAPLPVIVLSASE